MSNSPLVVYTKISPFKADGRIDSNGKVRTIDRITPHCVVGQCSIEALGAEFSRANKNASSNYGIGKDGRIGMFVEEADRSWCSSSRNNDARAVTIECASDAYDPYAFNDAVYAALINLCIDICRRNGKNRLIWFGDKDKTLGYNPAVNEMVLTVHRWFANKSCPGDWLYGRLGQLAERVNSALNPAPVVPDPTPTPTEGGGKMTYEEFYEFWLKLRRQLQDNDSNQYSEEARKWAVEVGLIKGGTPLPNGEANYMWEDFLTREQMVTLLYRFMQIIGK